MVAVNQIRDEYRLEAKTEGVEQAKAAAEGLASATDKITVASEKQERKVISVQRALEKFAAANDQAFRAQQQVERAQALVTRAFEQGLSESLAYQRATVVLADKQAALARITAQAAAANENNAASLARMRAQYDPIFAAQLRHRTALEGIAEAEKAGAITATTAIQARIAATRVMEDQTQKLERLAQTQKAAAQRQVNQQLVVPDRGADIAAYAAEMDRLRAKFDPLFAAQTAYRTGLAELRQALSTGAISEATYTAALDRRKAAFAEQVRGLGLVSNAERAAAAAAQETARATQAAASAAAAAAAKARAQGIVSGQTVTVDRGADVAAYGQQLDALRAKYNPLFAAGQAYKAQLVEIGQAARVGAISEAERAVALARTKEAFAAQVAAIRSATAASDGANRSVGLQAHAWQNLGFQANDALTMLASGSSVFQVVATQGGQVYQVLQGAQGGVSGALSSIKDRLLAISPLVGVFGALAAGAGLAAAAAMSYANAQRDVRLALLGIGQTAGLSAEQIDLISRQAADMAKISVAAAREIEAAFLKTGKVSGEVFLQATVAAANFAKATKQDNDKGADFLAQNLGSLASGGYEALAKQAANFDAALERQVRSLLEAGREADAQRVVLERFGQAYDKVGQQLTAWDRTLNAVKRGWDGLWDSLGRATSGASRSSAELLTVTETQIRNREALAKATNSDPASDQQYKVLRERAARLRAEIERTGEAVRTTSENARNSLKSLDKAAVNSAVPEIASLTQVRDNLAKANAELNGLEAGGGSAERIDAARKAVAALSAAERDYQTAGGAANMERAKANELLRAGLQGLQAVTPEQRAEAARQQALAETFGTVTTVQERSARATDAYTRAMVEQRAASDASSRAMNEATRTADEVARATAATGKSVEYLTAARKVDEGIATGVIARGEREAKIQEELRARLAQVNLQAAQRKRTLEDQASAQEAANASVAAGTLASSQASRQVQNEIELRALSRERDAASGEAKTELARRYDELAAAQQRQLSAEGRSRVLGLSEDEDRRIEYLRNEIELVGASTRERQKALAVLQAEQGLKRQGDSPTAPESVAYLDKVKLRADMETAKAEYDRLAQDISSAVAGIFDDLFKSGNKSLSSFFDSFARGFSRIGTRLLEQNLLAPLLSGGLGGASGTGGKPNSFLGIDLSDLRKTFKEGFGQGFDDTFGSWFESAKDENGKSMGFGSSKFGAGATAGLSGLAIGYSSQNPIIGAIGGGLSGLAAGAAVGGSMGPIGAVIGAGAGLIGGLLGKSAAKKAAEKKLKEQLEAYREAYREAEPEIRKLEATFRGESIGNVGGQIDAAFQQAVQANKTASQAGDQPRADQIMRDFEAYAERLRWQFIYAFEGTLKEVAAGFGTSGPFAQANAAVAALGESLKAFVADAQKLPEPDKNGLRARLAAQQAALAALDPPKALSDTQSRLAAIQGTASGLTRVLQDLGLSAEQAATAIRDRTAQAMKALRAEFSADLKVKTNEATGRGYLNEAADLIKERDALLADARAIGAGTADVSTYFRAAAQKIVDGSELTGDAFTALVRQFPALKGAVVEFGQAIDTAAAKAEAAARALGYQDRAFAAGTDTSTLSGALAAQDRKAAQDRAAEAKAGGRAMADLEKALAAERTAIIRDFKARAEEAEKAAAEATARRMLSAEDRLFAARNDSATLDGKLAEMERQHARERAEEVAAGGQALAKLEEAQAAERLKIVREAGEAEIAARKQALAEAQTFLDGATKNIRTYLDGLKAGPETNLSPGDRLKEAQRQFDAQLKLAKSGDRDALGSITTYADRLLDAGKGQYASGKGYQDILGSVTKQLGGLPKQLSAEQFIVNAIKAQTTAFQASIATGSASAIAAALKGDFTSLDANTDGLLSQKEFLAALGPKATVEEQRKALLKFAEIDLNGDGQLSKLELLIAETKGGLAAARASEVAKALAANFNKLDTNTNGLLSQKEFLAALGPKATVAEQQAALAVFRSIDLDGDGQISKLEALRSALGSNLTGINTVSKAVNDNFARLDRNGSGGLSLAEFKAAFGPLATKADQKLAEAYLKSIDADGDSIITKLELARVDLVAGLKANAPALVAKALKDNFPTIDVNADGGISYQEMVQALGPLATKAEQQAAKKVFDAIDADGNGIIAKSEAVRADLLAQLRLNDPGKMASAIASSFAAIDLNADAKINWGEYVKAVGPATKAEQAAAKAVFDRIDADGNGVIGAIEAANAAIAGAVKANSASAFATALSGNFATLDRSVNGVLDKAELADAIKGLATTAEQRAASLWLKQLDANGDGQLTQAELTAGRLLDLKGLTSGTTKAVNDNKTATDAATGAVRDGASVARDSKATLDAIKGFSADQKAILSTIQGYQNTAQITLGEIKSQSIIQKGQLDLLNRQYTLATPVKVYGTDYVLRNGMLDALNKIVFNTGQTVSGLIKLMSVNKPDGLAYAFAEGGWVSGPGTGTSDSIGARLSNGEFVVNAAAARLNAPYLEAMNDNRAFMPAMPMPVPVPAMGGGMDVGALVAELRALRAEQRDSRAERKALLEMVARVTKAGADKVAGKVEETTDEVAGQRDDARKAGAPARAGRGAPVTGKAA